MSPTHPADARPHRDGQGRAAFASGRGVLPGLHRIQSATTRDACHAAIAENAGLLEDLFGFSILLAAEAAEAGHGPALVWKSAGDAFAEGDVIAWLKQAHANPGRVLAFGAAASGLVMPGDSERGAPLVLLIADGALLPPELEIAMRDVAEFSARHLFCLSREDEMRRRQQRSDTEAM